MDATNLLVTHETFPRLRWICDARIAVASGDGGKLPGLLFIFEAFGLTTGMQRVANDFAKGRRITLPKRPAPHSSYNCIPINPNPSAWTAEDLDQLNRVDRYQTASERSYRRAFANLQ